MMQGWIRCKDRLRVVDQIGSYCDNLVWYSKIYNVLCSCMCQALFQSFTGFNSCGPPNTYVLYPLISFHRRGNGTEEVFKVNNRWSWPFNLQSLCCFFLQSAILFKYSDVSPFFFFFYQLGWKIGFMVKQDKWILLQYSLSTLD